MNNIEKVLNSITDSYELEIRMLDEAIDRVRKIHYDTPDEFSDSDICYECMSSYPCPTIQALDCE